MITVDCGISAAIQGRFWSKVDAMGDCWLWTGAHDSAGYGIFNPTKGKPVRPHRYVFDLLLEPVPADRVVDHLCRNRTCLNPAHLEIVTDAENLRRGMGPTQRAARDQKCRRGHPYQEADVRYRSNGKPVRFCRACQEVRLGRPLETPTGLRTHCPQGHPYSGDNLIITPRQRRCRACRVAIDRKRYEMQRESLRKSFEDLVEASAGRRQ